MKSIDNGSAPRLTTIWVCHQCPNEVRLLAEKDTETEIWKNRHLSIFVEHNEKEYCLHWDYINNWFDIRDTAATFGHNNYIVRLSIMPHSITPTNARDKLITYLIFS